MADAGDSPDPDPPARLGLRLPVAERGSVELSYSVLDTAPVGMALGDASGGLRWVNEALCRLVGRSEEEVLAGGMAALVHPDDLDGELHRGEALASGSTSGYETEQRWARSDGETRWVLVSGSLATDPDGEPLALDDGEPAVVRQVRDVTDEYEAKAAAAMARAELERRNLELQRSNEELEEFAYVVSHDLSEPLRVIAGHVQLLAQRYRERLDPEADEWIDFAVDGCARMRQLIDDLLAYSRAGRGERPTDTVHLGAVARDAVNDLGATIADTGADVVVDDLPAVQADPVQIGRVFSNLIANAIKFRRPDVPPRVHVRAARGDAAWRIEVVDNGVGVPARHRTRALRPFQRLHPRDAYPGTGMGLAIVRKIIERGGGTIWLDDAAGGGTVVAFTIPDPDAGPTSEVSR